MSLNQALANSAEKAAWLAELSQSLRTASLAVQQKEGRGPVRRLTRVEYETTVNDLLHIRTDLQSLFPEDAVTAGFDKVGEGLTLSAAHFTAYQGAAEKALNMAIERGAVLMGEAVEGALVPGEAVGIHLRDEGEMIGQREIPYRERAGKRV